ncbi:MAG: hypothetical protein GYB67_02210 [Chloroflexi bacterium]|nr:hypothetical protein [Chloroflexota bacterium]
MIIRTKHTNNPLTFGLALAAGTGILLMILALAFGVVGGADADMTLIAILFFLGLALLIGGIAGWLFVVQPFANFDDINQPQDAEPHDDHGAHDADHDDAHDDHAATPTAAHG